MTLSSKQLLKLNYAITILIAGYLLYIHVLTPHHVEYPIENIQEIAEKINKSLNYKIIFKEDSKEFNGTKPNGHDLKIDNALTISNMITMKIRYR